MMDTANILKTGGAVAIGSMIVIGPLQAQPLALKECRAEYRATVTDGTSSNLTWEQFRRVKCPPAAQVTPQAHPQTEGVREASAKHIAQCMRDWDAATHMTKEEWAGTCRRMVKDRIEFRLDHVK